MEQYEAQLLNVEQALVNSNASVQQRQELQNLKENLIELIALYTDEHAESTCSSKEGNKLEDEMDKFMTEINEIDKQSQDNQNLKEMVGEKCAAPHQHAWGAVAYHNAIICGIEKKATVDDEGNIDVQFRVLFTNPTHREMLPCSYYLEGSCRFDSENCHYSHGEVVRARSLRKYTEPDFSLLSRNCVVLAKCDDRLWYRGRVVCANYIEKECRVRLENKNKEREKDFNFEYLLPMHQDDSSDSDGEFNSEPDLKVPNIDTSVLLNTFSYELTRPLGDWEKHTRGIGSKLMTKMGYIYGTGLGSNGRGIITPVTAHIFPPGRSLDHCMELREAANGDKDLFNAEKKLAKDQRKQQALSTKTHERESNFFSFINDNILTTSKQAKSNLMTKNSLQSCTSKCLNVECVKVADNIRRKEREIAEVQKSLKRNTSTNSEIHNRLKHTLRIKMGELETLHHEEKFLSNEQVSRKTKEKLCVF